MTRNLEDFYRQRYLPLKLIGSRPGTLEQYEILLKHWRRFAVVLPLGEINSVTIAKFASYLAAGREPPTVNKYLRHLKAILRYARKRRQIQRMPSIPKLREVKRTPIAFLKEEFALILQAVSRLEGDYCDIPRNLFWRSLLLTDWDTGLRASALISTETLHIRLEGIPGIYIEPECQKDWEGGWYAIHAESVEAIKKIYNPARKYLWHWPYCRNTLANHFRLICHSAGIECEKRTCCLLHRIRKSTASYIKANGGDPQSQLGHSSPQVTERYLDPRIVGKNNGASFMPHGF